MTRYHWFIKELVSLYQAMHHTIYFCEEKAVNMIPSFYVQSMHVCVWKLLTHNRQAMEYSLPDNQQCQ